MQSLTILCCLLLSLVLRRSDIAECKHTAEAAPQASSYDPNSTAWAARQLGVHYLKRYFLLIAFRWVGSHQLLLLLLLLLLFDKLPGLKSCHQRRLLEVFRRMEEDKAWQIACSCPASRT